MGDEAKLIDPSGIPHFIGDLDTLDTDVMLLTADAGQFRASGSNVHTTFQHLSSFYSAPEAEQLFSTTLPVKTKSDAFADDLERVAGALSDFSLEVQPLVKKLDSLKAEATAFVNSVAGDDDWRKDHDKVDHNNDLWHDVNHTVAAFEAAERKAYNKITALIGGSPLIADDGSHSCNMYGFNAADLDQAKQTPWGAPAEKEYEGWAWLAHQTKQVWDGFWDDGVVATVHGLGTLVGWDGADAAGEAWKNLAKLGTGVGMTLVTLGAWGWVPEKDLPSWLRDSRHVLNQTAKGLVAWDQWKTNPGRAAGSFGFNVLTLLGTEGAGAAASGAGKSGAVVRTVSAVGKVGRVIDPMTYVGKVSKFAFARVGDTFSTLRNLHTGVTADLLKQADALRSPKIPANAIPYVDKATGKVVFLTDEGHVLNADGSLRQHVDEAAHELSSNDRQELSAPRLADHSRDLVGAGARAEHTPRDAASQLPDGTGSGFTDSSSTSHEAPAPGSHISGQDGGDHAAGNNVGHDAPSAGGHTTGHEGSGSGGGVDGPGSGSGHAAAPGDEPDRLAAATDRSVDLGRLGMPVVWREGHEPLFRSDNRAPDTIFESGFEPRDPSNTDLAQYVEDSEHSAFVSTSYRDDIGDEFGGKYTYEIDVPGGIDINRSLGDHPLSYEEEVAFPGGIRSEYIKGAYPYDYATGELGDLIPNPHYVPEAERVR
ncbi:protein phosphatase [Streptomyces sp. NPDC001093]|uniref:scabin-related ADP-ribosyltransferase n=1 Tax=Streptomyces sp. NPDC001093 TaxID=3154376 RepID=UPI0033181B59